MLQDNQFFISPKSMYSMKFVEKAKFVECFLSEALKRNEAPRSLATG